MSYADELEASFNGETKPEPISWEEHSQIVRNSFMDGVKSGREPIMKILRSEYAKNGSADLKKIIDRLDGEDLDRKSIIIMRPDAKWFEGLEDLCKLFSPSANFLEIGCYSGESSEVFAKYFKGGTVFCIDPWRPADGVETSEDTHNYTHKIDVAERVFDSRMSGFTNVVKLKGFDNEFLDRFVKKSLKGIYIDGNHYYEEVLKNIRNWVDKVADGGYICGHDYYDVTPGVVKAVDEVFGKPDYIFKDSSWAVDIDKWRERERDRQGMIIAPGM